MYSKSLTVFLFKFVRTSWHFRIFFTPSPESYKKTKLPCLFYCFVRVDGDSGAGDGGVAQSKGKKHNKENMNDYCKKINRIGTLIK